jgi:type I restriction enzyme S subunit
LSTDKEDRIFGLQPYDLLFARRSLVAEGAGKCSIVLTVNHPTVFESSIIRIRLNRKVCSPLFYYYYFASDIGFGAIQTLVNEVAASGIRSSELSKLKVIYPKPEIQERIAEILNLYDELIEVNLQKIQLLQDAVYQTYKEWFVRMRFPGFQNATFDKGIPTDWLIKEVASFGKVFTGKTPPTKVREYYGGQIPFIKTPDLHKNMFVFNTEECLTEKGNGVQKRSTLPRGAICVSCIGSGGIIGITTAERSQTNQQINSLIPSDKKNLEFLFMRMIDLKETIELFGATGATMTNLSKSKFEKLKILYPSYHLIEKYNHFSAPIFSQIENLQRQNDLLREVRNRLLPRLISGKLRIKATEELLCP